MSGCTAGMHNGEKYFDCPSGRGYFCRLDELTPDERFNSIPLTSGYSSSNFRKFHILFGVYIVAIVSLHTL